MDKRHNSFFHGSMGGFEIYRMHNIREPHFHLPSAIFFIEFMLNIQQFLRSIPPKQQQFLNLIEFVKIIFIKFKKWFPNPIVRSFDFF